MSFVSLASLAALGAVLMIGVAQLSVRRCSPQAALRLAIAGCLVLALELLQSLAPIAAMWVLEPALRYFAAGLAVWALVLLARTKDVSHQRPSEPAPTLHRDSPPAGRPLDLESLLGAVPPAPTLRHSPEPAPTVNRPQPTQLRVDAAGAADAHGPREVPALATLPTYLAPLEGCPGWTERRIPVAGDGPWSLRGAAGSEGPVLACAPAGVPTDIKLLAWRLGSDGSAQPLEGQVSASRDMAMAGGDTIEVVTAAPARGECVLRCLQLSPHRAEQRIDSVPGVMTGISMARANDLRWVAYLRSNLRDNDEQLFVACRKDSVASTGSWRVFPVGEPGRRGTQTSIAALPGGRAAVVTQRRPAGWGGGGAIHVAAASGPGGLDAVLSAASAKSITVELVDAAGRVQEELVDATDNFHTSGVAIDDRGRLAVATLHCDDPPEGTRFRIRLATREADGWAAEDVGTTSGGGSPFHLKLLPLPGGELAVFALVVDLGLRTLSAVLFRRGERGWRPVAFPPVPYADETAAHYSPVADALVVRDRIHIFVPELVNPRNPALGGANCVHWYEGPAALHAVPPGAGASGAVSPAATMPRAPTPAPTLARPQAPAATLAREHRDSGRSFKPGTNVVVTIHDETGMSTRVPLGARDMTIGSNEGARVRLVGLPPSTQAKVYRANDGRLLLRNVGATTDIMLNGRILLDEAELAPEDLAKVGTFLFVFTEE